jgi:hypothetical protein
MAMPRSDAKTPDEYVASLPGERRRMVSAIRETINANLPDGYVEGMAYGMIGWSVPLERFGDTYNGQPLGLVALASQKAYVSVYLNSVYADPTTEAWFRKRYAASGRTLNMGKSCVRFRRFDEVPLDVIGETIARADIEKFTSLFAAERGSARKSRQTSA